MIRLPITCHHAQASSRASSRSRSRVGYGKTEYTLMHLTQTSATMCSRRHVSSFLATTTPPPPCLSSPLPTPSIPQVFILSSEDTQNEDTCPARQRGKLWRAVLDKGAILRCTSFCKVMHRFSLGGETRIDTHICARIRRRARTRTRTRTRTRIHEHTHTHIHTHTLTHNILIYTL